MMRSKPPNGQRALLTSAAVLLLAVAGAQVATAAGIAWEKRGAFEACLDDRMNAWVVANAESILNEDPAIGDLGDMDVALWAVTVLEGCETQAGRGNQTSEARFSRYMAHWREHIYAAARTIRQKLTSD
jgi:hypothetical protein